MVFGWSCIQGMRWFDRTFTYTSESIVSSTSTKGPIPSQVKQPQNMTDPPPNFTVGLTQSTLYASPVVRQTLIRPSDLNKANRNSSDHTICFHSSFQVRLA